MASTLVRAALAAGLVLATSAALAGEITLYERPGFQGRSMTLRNNMPDLDRTRFNDRAGLGPSPDDPTRCRDAGRRGDARRAARRCADRGWDLRTHGGHHRIW